MKKLIFILSTLAIFNYCYSQQKPLKGYYIKMNLGADSLQTSTGILHSAFIQIDSIQTVNTAQISWNQVFSITFSFHIWESYYRYNHYYQSILYPVVSFTVSDISAFDGDPNQFNEVTFPAMIITNFALVLQKPLNKFTINDYY